MIRVPKIDWKDKDSVISFAKLIAEYSPRNYGIVVIKRPDRNNYNITFDFRVQEGDEVVWEG